MEKRKSNLEELPLDECYACMYECIQFSYFIESGQFKSLDEVKKALDARANAYQNAINIKKNIII